jgi:hypothetical protein
MQTSDNPTTDPPEPPTVTSSRLGESSSESASPDDTITTHGVLPAGTVNRVNPDGTTTRVAVGSLTQGETLTLDEPASDLAADTGTPPVPSAPVWLEGDSNPFGIPVLDIRPITWTTTSTTGDPSIAKRFMASRAMTGAEYDGQHPQPSVAEPCDITYPPLPGLTSGPLFIASVMEEKWDVFLTRGLIRVSRSWTGEVIFVARTRPHAAADQPIHIDRLEFSAAANVGADEAITEFDFVMKAYVYGQILPYKAPDSLVGGAPEDIALAAFARHGRRAAYTTFTTMALGLEAPEPERMSDLCASGDHTQDCSGCPCPCHLTPRQALARLVADGLVADEHMAVARAMTEPAG